MESILESLKTNLSELKALPVTPLIQQGMTNLQRAITALENAALEV